MVHGKRSHTLATHMEIRAHTLVSGVAPKLGGADEGPDPHELIEAALAACTVITVQMYANRKNWKLESADVSVKIVAEGELSRITRDISFRGELDPEQRARLIEIADKCPIHKLLTSRIEIETREIQPGQAPVPAP